MNREQARLVELLADALGLTITGASVADAGIRWHRLFGHARRQRVLPWLHRGLQAAPDVPPRLLSVAAGIRRDNAQRNMLLAHRLCLVTEALSDAGVRAIAFKGPVAAIRFHGALDSRPCGDLDILVPEAAFHHAETVLVRCGYEKFADHPGAFQAAYQDAEHSHSIDLHWRLPPAAIKIDTSSLWQRAEAVQILGRSVLTFNEQDSIIIAAVNAMKEYWNVTLHQFVDLTVALHRLNPSAAQELIERSKSLNVQRMLMNADFVCRQLFPRRDSAYPAIRAPHRPAIEVLNQLFAPSGERNLLHTLPSAEEYFVRLQDHWSGRMKSRSTNLLRRLRRRWGVFKQSAAPRLRNLSSVSAKAPRI